jgi:hypothetical protein
MTPESTTHLSDEALNDVLIGLGSPESHAHLDACKECRAQVQAFRGDVQLFNAASIAWSESRWPIARITAPHRGRPRIPFASWTAVAATLVIMALAVWHHRSAAPPAQVSAPQSLPADSEAQIAQDNQLLQAVNAAISPEEESPIVEYKIMESPNSHARAHSGKRVK